MTSKPTPVLFALTDTPTLSGSFMIPCSQCTDCTALDLGYTTLGVGTLTSDECVCKAGYFMNYINATYLSGLLTHARRFCEECPTIGYDCRSPGNALETLRMMDGYIRSHNLSTLVRQCFNKAFCTPPNVTNITSGLLALMSTKSNLGQCAANHAGPYCEICAAGYIMSNDGCAQCTGSRALSFVLPVVISVLGLMLGIFLCRTGRARALMAIADSAIKGSKQGDETMLEDALRGYAKDRANEVKQSLQPQANINKDAARVEASAAAPAPAPAALLCRSSALSPSAGKRRATLPASPPASPPDAPPDACAAPPDACAAALPSEASSFAVRVRRLTRQKSVLRRSKAALVRRGCTAKKVASAQTKFRILVSLVQVLGQLGIVFSIPYPDFYSDLISILGVFSLDLLEIMPLECTFNLNHDHYLLIRTLMPLFIALLAWLARRGFRARAAHKRKVARENANESKAEALGKKANADETVADQMLTFTFVIFYLLYPSNSANIFATFQCETLDDPEQSSFLRKDFRVDCKTPFHQGMIYYALGMVFVYPLGSEHSCTRLNSGMHSEQVAEMRSQLPRSTVNVAVPALYCYLLFAKHGKEMRLLRSLELECAALGDEQSAADELAAARDGLRKARRTQSRAKATRGDGSTSTSYLEGAKEDSSLTSSTLAARRPSLPQQLRHWTSEPMLALPRRGSRASRRDSGIDLAPDSIKLKIAQLEREQDELRKKLPDYVQKLILGYELRTFYFEIIECFRKLAIVCLPVFFQPSGSVVQLMFGLIVCFLTFGTHMVRNEHH